MEITLDNFNKALLLPNSTMLYASLAVLRFFFFKLDNIIHLYMKLVSILIYMISKIILTFILIYLVLTYDLHVLEYRCTDEVINILFCFVILYKRFHVAVQLFNNTNAHVDHRRQNVV